MSGRPTLFTMANLFTDYWECLHTPGEGQVTTAWMLETHLRNLDKQRGKRYGIPQAIDFSAPWPF